MLEVGVVLLLVFAVFRSNMVVYAAKFIYFLPVCIGVIDVYFWMRVHHFCLKW